jgi:hypothetical protein
VEGAKEGIGSEKRKERGGSRTCDIEQARLATRWPRVLRRPRALAMRSGVVWAQRPDALPHPAANLRETSYNLEHFFFHQTHYKRRRIYTHHMNRTHTLFNKHLPSLKK